MAELNTIHRKSPLKAIHQHCYDCVGGSCKELRLCPCTECALYSFRFGKNPYRKKTKMSDEQRKKMGEFLREKREEALL